jgi:DNA helicase HerA-like ATPase
MTTTTASRAAIYGDSLGSLSDRLAYFQRPPLPDLDVVSDATHARARRLTGVAGIGRADKSALPPRLNPGEAWSPPLTGLVIGMHERSPLALQVVSVGGHLSTHLGVWSSRVDVNARELEARARNVSALLRSSYIDIDIVPADAVSAGFTTGGYVLGVPVAAAPTETDPRAAWDRIADAMGAQSWGVLVLAQPVPEATSRALRDDLLIEWRAVAQEAQVAAATSPLAEHYDQLLKNALVSATEAMNVGAWRTAVYLFGDADSYLQLASTWRSVFSATPRDRDPITVRQTPATGELVRWWAMPDAQPAPAPGRYRRPFSAQSLLTSRELAQYVSLPEREHQGFTIFRAAAFDTAPTPRTTAFVEELGQVVDGRRPTSVPYQIDVGALTKHCFVTGVTGAGKTNTVLNVLGVTRRAGAGFLVLEPAKAEYRSLLSQLESTAPVRVFTVGDETVTPLRINPFEVPPGTSIGVHIDLLRSLFTATFGLWTPLPQILEQAIHLAYTDLGWDVATGTNRRLGPDDDRRDAFPTMSQLYNRVDELVDELGFDPEATGRIRGSLAARLNSLRVGAKGRMFDVTHGTPAAHLFDDSAILELERLGDDQDKAFTMGLILIRLAEHRRAQGPIRDTLRHLLVVEEAHRLLGKPTAHGGDEADAGGKAVETFTNLLAEVRAYGQGIVVADQVPARLAPEVLKNTNLKIVHRLVADDDRKSVGASMGMTNDQMTALVALEPFRAAVFSEGDDSPLLVQMANARQRLSPVEDEELRARVAHVSDGAAEDTIASWIRDLATEICSSVGFRRALSKLVSAVAAVPTSAPRLWPGVAAQVRPRIPQSLTAVESSAVWLAVANAGATWIAQRRCGQAGAPYALTNGFRAAVADLLAALGTGTSPAAAGIEVARVSREALRREVDPYPQCHRICPQRSCLHRWPIVEVMAASEQLDPFRDARAEDEAEDNPDHDAMFTTAQRLAALVVQWPDDTTYPDELDAVVSAARTAALCATQIAVSQLDQADADAVIRSIVDANLDLAASPEPFLHESETD